jgi:hypothetical protein
MTIAFENVNDVIVYPLEKIISFGRENQYMFVANCTWWITGVVGLDKGLTIYIDNQEMQKLKSAKETSTTPKEIARMVSMETRESVEARGYSPSRNRKWKSIARGKKAKARRQQLTTS